MDTDTGVKARLRKVYLKKMAGSKRAMANGVGSRRGTEHSPREDRSRSSDLI